MKFQIDFTGRKKGAIGKFYQFSEMVEAENADEAILSLYENYDNVIARKIKNTESEFEILISGF